MSQIHARTSSLDDLLRPLRAAFVRNMLKEHRAAKLKKPTYYDEWVQTLGVSRKELDNILSAVVEMDSIFQTFQHAQLVVKRGTEKPGREFYNHLQQIAETVAAVIEQKDKALH
ncbi:hypothetical protein WDW86_15715 [Bdellovibrionota bacterium FG-2]